MTLSRRLAPHVVAGLVSPTFRELRRGLAETRRRLRREPHRVHYFHEVADPYSHLAAQVVAPLLARYDVVLVPHLVGAAESAPEPEMLAAYARKDAADIAPAYGLDFPRGAEAPEIDLVRRATRILAALDTDAFVARAPAVGRAVWTRDRGAMERLAQEGPDAGEDGAQAAVLAGTALRKRLGHYSGAMFHYGGEWYWGVDRLGHLEERLRGLGIARRHDEAPIVSRPEEGREGGPQTAPADQGHAPVVLEFFLSLRSPYTYIAMERVYDLPRRLGVELRLRPVLPMVMRGMSVPASKRLYITLDTKREAERQGVPFGKVCDPVGEPVERGFSLYRLACEQGRAGDYLLSFARGVFAEGVDAGTEAGLRRIAERAGVSWEAAQAARGDPSWREELEENRRAMFATGLWGVPSFRLPETGGFPEFATWGQDRLWLVEQEIRRRRGSGDAI